MTQAIEEPQYQLVERLGGVEIRHYQPTVQAVTELASNNETSRGFRRLAGFIFGGNEKQQSIAMTAPVQETLGESRPQMAFTLPAGYSLDDVPGPDDARVEIRDVPARTLAVVSFSGWATEGKIKRMTEKLSASLAEYGIDSVGPALLHQYNPPWTPPFMRRNEVAVEVDLVVDPQRETAYAF